MDSNAVPPPTRRDVIRAGLAMPAIFGLGALLGGEPVEAGPEPDRGGPSAVPPPQDPATAPSWWQQFLQRAREAPRAPIVVRVPKDAASRAALGTALVDLTDRGTRDQRVVMLTAAIACLTDGQMRVCVPQARPDDGLIAVDVQMARIRGIPLPADVASEGARLATAIERLANGEDGARLALRAKSARANVAGATLAAYDALATAEDWRAVAGSVIVLLPLIAMERKGLVAPARLAALDRLLDDVASDRLFSAAHTGLNLPFGVLADSEGVGCGTFRNQSTYPPPACGMAFPTAGSFKFLHFLVDRDA